MCRKMLYLLVLTLVLLTGCTSKINFDKNGISEETYNSTLALMERFNSNQFGEKIFLRTLKTMILMQMKE